MKFDPLENEILKETIAKQAMFMEKQQKRLHEMENSLKHRERDLDNKHAGIRRK